MITVDKYQEHVLMIAQELILVPSSTNIHVPASNKAILCTFMQNSRAEIKSNNENKS